MCLFWVSMHCRPSCTQGFVPFLCHLHLLTTATSYQQQSHQRAETGPRLSVPLLCPPVWPQEEAVLPRSRVKRSRDQNLPYSHRHLHICHVTSTPPSHCGFSQPRSQKHTHTHLTTKPNCVFSHLLGTVTSLIYLEVLPVFYGSLIRLSTSYFVGYR